MEQHISHFYGFLPNDHKVRKIHQILVHLVDLNLLGPTEVTMFMDHFNQVYSTMDHGSFTSGTIGSMNYRYPEPFNQQNIYPPYSVRSPNIVPHPHGGNQPLSPSTTSDPDANAGMAPPPVPTNPGRRNTNSMDDYLSVGAFGPQNVSRNPPGGNEFMNVTIGSSNKMVPGTYRAPVYNPPGNVSLEHSNTGEVSSADCGTEYNISSTNSSIEKKREISSMKPSIKIGKYVFLNDPHRSTFNSKISNVFLPGFEPMTFSEVPVGIPPSTLFSETNF